MKVVAFLLFLAALALVGVFVWPLLQPEVTMGPQPAGFSQERSQAVAGLDAGTTPPATDAGSPAPSPSPRPDAVDGPLCDQLFDASAGRVIGAPQGQPVRKGLVGPPNAWTWVSLWAAWCKPCKEEMPLLSSWAADVRKRGGALRVLFLSIDDDERQLNRYIEGDGAGLVGEFVWLKDEAARARYYSALGISNPPTLPVQAILDPSGLLRCVRVGSISRHELDEAAKLFGW